MKPRTHNSGPLVDQSKPAKFWMVYVPDNGSNPTVRHPTLELATEEAERLARKTGKQAFVLQAVAVSEVEPAPIKSTKL
jgi:hypothetical protein